MNQRSMTIGRAPDNDLVVADKHVSSHHARLLREGDSILIEDLNSSNHVYVNGNAVTRKRVSVGDSVQLSFYYQLNWDHPVIRRWLAMGGGVYAPVPVIVESRLPAQRVAAPAEQWKGPDDSYCTSCGAVLRKGIQFCNSCGAQAAKPLPEVRRQREFPSEASVRLNHMQSQMDARHEQQMRAMANAQDMTGKAWGVLLAYYFGFIIIGFIFNLVYLGRCSSIKNATGYQPPGHGCLVALIVTHFIIPLIVILVAAMAGIDLLNELGL